MPFAPSILEEDAGRYIKNWDLYVKKAAESMDYMIIVCDSLPLAQRHFAAAVHQKDKSMRPQIVRKDANARYHYLIETFKEKTGIGGVLNTSLNMHGFPLSGTLENALFTFQNSGLKYMAIENFLIEKV